MEWQPRSGGALALIADDGTEIVELLADELALLPAAKSAVRFCIIEAWDGADRCIVVDKQLEQIVCSVRDRNVAEALIAGLENLPELPPCFDKPGGPTSEPF